MGLEHDDRLVLGPSNTEISSEDRAILALAGFVCFISLLSSVPFLESVGSSSSMPTSDEVRDNANEPPGRPKVRARRTRFGGSLAGLDCVVGAHDPCWREEEEEDASESGESDSRRTRTEQECRDERKHGEQRTHDRDDLCASG